MKVRIQEAKTQLSQLIKAAQAGEDVLIANRGEPVARLVATSATTPASRAPNFLKWLADNPLPTYAHRSAVEIDATIEAQRSAWD
jgi:prevent-host-death family protein